MRQMIDAHHEAAEASGTRIVHCCGFDCVPSEVGALMVAHHLKTQHGKAVSDAALLLQDGARCTRCLCFACTMRVLACALRCSQQMRRSLSSRCCLVTPSARCYAILSGGI